MILEPGSGRRRTVPGQLLALTLAGAAGLACVQTAGAASPGSSGSSLTALAEEFVGATPGGVSVVVVRDGVTTTAVAGDATADGTLMTPEARFRVGSISKMFVATMVLQLVDTGRVDLDAALSTYVPDTPIGGDVPVRMLLRHRSGLPSYMEDEEFVNDEWGDPSRVFSPDDLIAYIADEPVVAPDTEYVYMNTNFILLGQLVEAVEGTDLNTALRAHVTEPLGLSGTQFEIADDPPIADLAGPWEDGLYSGDPAASYQSFASGTWAAGALVTSAPDVQRFLAALIAGELVSESSFAAMVDPNENGGYGLGIEVLNFPSGATFYGHRGEVVGYRSFAGIEPTSGDSFVVLTNNSALDAVALSDRITADW